METNASAIDLTAFPQPSISLRSIAGAAGRLMLRSLKAFAEGCVQSGAYYPYWIATSPHAKSRGTRQA
jgi:hypothetical protein